MVRRSRLGVTPHRLGHLPFLPNPGVVARDDALHCGDGVGLPIAESLHADRDHVTIGVEDVGARCPDCGDRERLAPYQVARGHVLSDGVASMPYRTHRAVRVEEGERGVLLVPRTEGVGILQEVTRGQFGSKLDLEEAC